MSTVPGVMLDLSFAVFEALPADLGFKLEDALQQDRIELLGTGDMDGCIHGCRDVDNACSV